MIRNIKRKDIDLNKYNLCVKNAYNFRVYAYAWYLDIVANKQWNVLVLNDYEAVTPLPYKRIKRKFLKKMVSQPFFCQQLGIFSKQQLSKENFELIIKNFYKLKPYNYNFNSSNSKNIIQKKHLKFRNNFELNLDKTYLEIKQGYSKNLIRNIKKGVKTDLQISTKVTIQDFITLKKENSIHKIKKENFITMTQLMQKIEAHNLGKLYAVKQENNIVAIAFFITTKDRIIHLFSVSNPIGKRLGGIPVLFDNIIQKNENKNITFDFEGSMIPGVAKFFKSFGSKNNPYLVFNKS